MADAATMPSNHPPFAPWGTSPHTPRRRVAEFGSKRPFCAARAYAPRALHTRDTPKGFTPHAER
jgi:hypothetical protein